MLRILLIDDQPQALAALRASLALHHDLEVVGEAEDATTAGRLLAGESYNVVLLSATLPNGVAYDLATAVRKESRLIFVTEAQDPSIHILESAAAEYWLKPVHPERVKRLVDRLRAPAPPASALVSAKVGNSTQLLRVGQIRLIESRENYTEITLAAAERIFVRRTMQQWASLLPAGQFVRVHRGQFLNLDYVARTERTSQGENRLHLADQALPPIDVKRRHWPAVRESLERWRNRPLNAPATIDSGPTIAVLPFANLTRHPDSDTLCDSLTDELINLLAKVPGLRVAARTSAFYFRGKNVLVSEIARQLGVEFIVEGSLRRRANGVRISAQLIRAASGFQLWSEKFDRSLADLLTIENEIATEIAHNLRLKITAPPAPVAPPNPAVNWLIREGRHFWNLRTRESFSRAEAAYTKALALDPRSGPAHAGLADLYVVRGMYALADGHDRASDHFDRVRLAAGQAIAADPTLAEPSIALAFAAFHEGRQSEAERSFPPALALNPNLATGHQFYAWTLCGGGRLATALEVYAKAIDLDPLSFINLDRHAAMLLLAGRAADALAANERAMALRPDIYVGNVSQRAPILLALGRREEAIAAARIVRSNQREEPFRRNSDADAIFVLHQTGQVREAADYADEILAKLPKGNYIRGFVLGAIGQYEEGIAALNTVPPIMLPQLYWSPMWDEIRGQPPFQRLIDRLGRRREYELARESRSVAGFPNVRP